MLKIGEIRTVSFFHVAVALVITGSLVLYWLGACGLLAKAMHAQAMEYNEIYTGDGEEEDGADQQEGSDEREDSKLPTLKKRK